MIIINAFIGFLTGIAASMGLGGGSVLVIWLTAFAGLPPYEAAGTNLLFFIPVATAAVVFNSKKGNVAFGKGAELVLCGLPGAIAGALLAAFLGKGVIAVKLLGCFLTAFGAKELLFSEKKPPSPLAK